jgi:hypothetical protein
MRYNRKMLSNIKFWTPQFWRSIIYNYCTWTRSIWGFMEQSTTILNGILFDYLLNFVHSKLFYFVKYLSFCQHKYSVLGFLSL